MTKLTLDDIVDWFRECSAERPLAVVIRYHGWEIDEFYKFIQKDPILTEGYNFYRAVALEALLDIAASRINAANSMTELKKAQAYLSHVQWKIEKIIPQVYGAKVQIDVNKTVDIRGALEEAKVRAGIIEATYKTVVAEELKKELPTPLTEEDLLG
jgi:hypothetical protein